MPYILSWEITEDSPGLWFEGPALEVNKIYSIEDEGPPPVNYNSYTLKPHSLTHMDACSHIVSDGPNVEAYFEKHNKECFYGRAVVLSLPGQKWREFDREKGLFSWEVSKAELLESLERVIGSTQIPPKVLITADGVPRDKFGRHDPAYALHLSEEAAKLLTENPDFNLYGTSWKSTDFKPGSPERPIHKIILKQAVIFECLRLDHVPEGEYFISAFPLPIQGASESPATPVLFTREELNRF